VEGVTSEGGVCEVVGEVRGCKCGPAAYVEGKERGSFSGMW
jgi:hypothetical protein